MNEQVTPSAYAESVREAFHDRHGREFDNDRFHDRNWVQIYANYDLETGNDPTLTADVVSIALGLLNEQ